MLDNFCYVLHNISRLPRHPDGLEGEIFDLLFKSADLSNFATNERTQYFEDMHSKEDIERMIAYAKEEGMEEGMEKGMVQGMEKGTALVAKAMLEKGMDVETIVSVTGLSVEQIQSL